MPKVNLALAWRQLFFNAGAFLQNILDYATFGTVGHV
jgi:hypothetical protein